jgi:hypothetical protein
VYQWGIGVVKGSRPGVVARVVARCVCVSVCVGVGTRLTHWLFRMGVGKEEDDEAR